MRNSLFFNLDGVGLLPGEIYNVKARIQLPDTLLSQNGGLLRTHVWFQRERTIREMTMQRARFYGDISVKGLQRIIHTSLPPEDVLKLPLKLTQDIIDNLPPPPTTWKERNKISRRIENFTTMPLSSKGLLCVTLETYGYNCLPPSLSDAKIYTKSVEEVPYCYIEWITTMPFLHCYKEEFRKR